MCILPSLSRFHPSLSNSVAETLIHTLISSWLDYSNGVLFSLPYKSLDSLQYMQNSAASMLTHTKTLAAHHPILRCLDCFPVKFCINNNLLLLTIHALAPQYLTDLLKDYTPERNLEFSDMEIQMQKSRPSVVEDFMWKPLPSGTLSPCRFPKHPHWTLSSWH